MQCAKVIDSRAALMTWNDEDALCNLNGDEIKLVSDKNILKYIDMPPIEGNICTGKTYYGNGIRLKTA